MKGEDRVRIDLCKLPHHGSRGNVTNALIESIACRDYLVSTDGRTFGHPDDAALARILCTSALPPRLFFNYETQRARNWINTALARGAEIVLPPTSIRVEAA
jgi:hypothetical protein